MCSQPGKPFAQGQLRVSRQSADESKMLEWEGHQGQWKRFLGIKTEENPGKPQLGKHRGHLASVTRLQNRIKEANRRWNVEYEVVVTTSSMLFPFLRSRRIA